MYAKVGSLQGCEQTDGVEVPNSAYTLLDLTRPYAAHGLLEWIRRHLRMHTCRLGLAWWVKNWSHMLLNIEV